MQLKIKMKWVQVLNRWHIIKDNGFTMYDIPDCENIDMIFEHPSKETNEEYEITVRRTK